MGPTYRDEGLRQCTQASTGKVCLFVGLCMTDEVCCIDAVMRLER